MPKPPGREAEFDRFAAGYEDMHAKSVAMSGEGTEYFASYKQKMLVRILGEGFDRPVLDFGCGTGNLSRLLVESFGAVHGYDPSAQSLRFARERAPSATFFEDAEKLPDGHYGAVVLANVLHHVLPVDRPDLLRTLQAKTAPGGRLIVFEHNPYNPVTRQVVASCPLDEVAELISSRGIRRLLEAGGYGSVRREYIVFFPRALAALRRLEQRLSWLPLGAQVCVWGTKS
jgi:ubiquinone/menaquinone biosynthesis C-methylase UbiE